MPPTQAGSQGTLRVNSPSARANPTLNGSCEKSVNHQKGGGLIIRLRQVSRTPPKAYSGHDMVPKDLMCTFSVPEGYLMFQTGSEN
ncbi:hypothetical protein IAD21_00984 [Abditibacteriota bacterium]|nr:hypothetical protein IAD21_00984 [Abditibacteriota bacterium]